MPFSEALKLSVKRKAHFTCCLCHSLVVEVHHIIPQNESGPDTVDNAAPLCPSCHENYGSNPQRRKFIREARDLWYEICAKRYASDPDRLAAIESGLTAAASKDDVAALSKILNQFQKSVEEKLQDVLPKEANELSREKERSTVLRAAIGMLSQIAVERGRPQFEVAIRNYGLTLYHLRHISEVDIDTLNKIFDLVLRAKPPPPDPFSCVLYYSVSQVVSVLEFTADLEMIQHLGNEFLATSAKNLGAKEVFQKVKENTCNFSKAAFNMGRIEHILLKLEEELKEGLPS